MLLADSKTFSKPGVEIVTGVTLIPLVAEPKKREKILQVCSAHFDVPLEDMKSKSRKKDICFARFMTMTLLHIYGCMSLEKIGEYFGGRDHTSVSHGKQVVRDAMKTGYMDAAHHYKCLVQKISV